MPGINAGKHRFRFLDETLEQADAGYGISDRSFHMPKDFFKIWKHLPIDRVGRIGIAADAVFPRQRGMIPQYGAPKTKAGTTMSGRSAY